MSDRPPPEMPEEAREFVEKLREFVGNDRQPEAEPFDLVKARRTFLDLEAEARANPPDLSGGTTITVTDATGPFADGDVLIMSNGFARLHRITSVDSATCMSVERLGFFRQVWWWVRRIAGWLETEKK